MFKSRVIVIALFLIGLTCYLLQPLDSQEKSSESANTSAGQKLEDPFGNGPVPPQTAPRKNEDKPSVEPPRQVNAPATAEAPNRRRFPSVRLEFLSESAARAKIERALSIQDKFQYPNVALADVLHDLSIRFGIPVILNAKALEDAGVGTDTPVNMDLQGVSLRSALAIMLDDHDLTYRIDNEVLLITSHEEAESRLFTTIYDVTALLPKESERIVYRSSEKASDLINLITSTIDQHAWADVGGVGAIEFIDHQNMLVVSQTEVTTGRVENLLAIMKEFIDAKTPVQTGQQDRPQDQMIVKIYKVFRFDAAANSKVNDKQPSANLQKSTSFNTAQFGGGTVVDSTKAVEQALAERRAKAFDIDSLTKFIPSIIEPGTWDEGAEGKGSIGVFGENVVVRHLPQVHQKVGQLLADLDLLKPRPGRGHGNSSPPATGGFGGGGGGGFFDVDETPR